MPLAFMFLLLVPILLWAFTTFDHLIQLEYESFQYHWILDKQPVGMQWRPENYPRNFHGGKGSQYYWFMWLFKKPDWVKKSNKATILLTRYRILILAWNMGIILWFFVGPRFFR